ncbi:sulfotransferase [Candidatus Rhodobacter oscarellae]|nr:sulfotransferase [Candidatus Rhodobacter lobularis]
MFPNMPNLRHYPELDGKTLLICVGAMKCATSWIYNYLAKRDGVTVSPLKELHFFNTKFTAHALGDMDGLALRRLGFHIEQPGEAPDNLRRRDGFQASVDRAQMIYDDNAYFGHFARIVDPQTRTFCDVTPAYSVLGPTGFEYMRAFCASQDIRLKVLFVMRDPLDRLWSQLRHMTQGNKTTNFVENWAKALTAPAICARADYRGTVTDLDQTFPEQDVLYLFYETLFTAGSLQSLCALADTRPGPADTDTRQNETQLKAEMPGAARAAAMELLAPQYAFCRARFGADIPEAWQA